MERNKGYLVIALCLVIFFSACGGTKQEDSVWKIVDVDFKNGNSLPNDTKHDNCFLSITKNNTYVFFLNGYFSEGKVKKSENEYKMLRNQDNRLAAAFTISEDSRNEATLDFTLFDVDAIQKTSNNDEVAHSTEIPVGWTKNGFTVDIEKGKRSVKFDLYDSKYNKWRVKPTKKETDAEIRSRVRNHIEFMQLYFENALEAGLRVVSEPNLASPFEVYSNGISMRKFDEIRDWQDLFFDGEDAKKGYDIIESEMRKDFALAKTKNAFELNADIFRKLLKMID